MQYHYHHIIPKHMGGSDDPTNIIKLSIPDHALAHKALFEAHGCWQDDLAYKGLSGLIPSALVHREAVIAANKARTGKKNPHKNPRKPRAKETKPRPKRTLSAEHRAKISEGGKGRTSPMKGKTFSPEYRQKLSDAQTKRWAAIKGV